MGYVITQACIGTKDQSCVDVCPVDAIHHDGDEDLILYISPDECIDCAACESECPTSAIYDDDALPEDQQACMAINALWFEDKDAARTKVREIVGS